LSDLQFFYPFQPEMSDPPKVLELELDGPYHNEQDWPFLYQPKYHCVGGLLAKKGIYDNNQVENISVQLNQGTICTGVCNP
jgi:hypothetical protein